MDGMTLMLALGIGIVAGLRSFTAPALVSWAAHLGWLKLEGSPLAFMDSVAAVVVFSLLAVVEYVGDVLPKTPSRTTPGPLVARVVTGGLSGAGKGAVEGDSCFQRVLPSGMDPSPGIERVTRVTFGRLQKALSPQLCCLRLQRLQRSRPSRLAQHFGTYC